MALRAASRRLASHLRAAPICLGSERWIQSTSSNDAQGHPKPTALPKLKDNFLDGTSSTYLEELEERYRSDPASVDKTWASFFGSLGEIESRRTDVRRQTSCSCLSEFQGIFCCGMYGILLLSNHLVIANNRA